MTDWSERVKAALSHLEARKRVYTVDQSLKLIDFLAEKGVATEAEMQGHGPKDFVATILGHVTTAVHGPGAVQKDGGWYRHAYASGTYTIDPGFAEAWLAAIPGRSH